MSSSSLYPPFLDIRPFTGQVQAEIVLPGSKSISNRALILAALCNGSIKLNNMLFSRDTEIMMTALTTLGFAVSQNQKELSVEINGLGGAIPQQEARLHIGNAGTAARFLTAFLALQKGGRYHLDGDEAMYRRPMAGLLNALARQGTRFTFHGQPGHFPFTMETHGLQGGLLEVDASESSQILSALLMVSPFTDSPLKLKLTDATVSWPFVEVTLKMLEEFGLAIHDLEGQATHDYFELRPLNQPAPTHYDIEPDLSAASYFTVLPLLHGGWVRFPQLKGRKPDQIKQGDIAFSGVLETLGMQIDWNHPAGLTFQLSSPDNAWKARHTTSSEAVHYNFNAFSDTFLTLAALAPLFPFPITISGIEHTRKQETDRVHAMFTELQRIGVAVTEHPDALELPAGKGPVLASDPISIHTYEDHRIAMSFAILGTWDARGDGQSWLRILDPSCCRKTFPHFFDTLNQILWKP